MRTALGSLPPPAHPAGPRPLNRRTARQLLRAADTIVRILGVDAARKVLAAMADATGEGVGRG